MIFSSHAIPDLKWFEIAVQKTSITPQTRPRFTVNNCMHAKNQLTHEGTSNSQLASI
jgi:hypothetical protein